jgi:hypothetical protein
LKLPHEACVPGIECVFIQPPLAYWSKSRHGAQVVSKFAAGNTTGGLPAACAEAANASAAT